MTSNAILFNVIPDNFIKGTEGNVNMNLGGNSRMEMSFGSKGEVLMQKLTTLFYATLFYSHLAR